jgi:DNA processing protein
VDTLERQFVLARAAGLTATQWRWIERERITLLDPGNPLYPPLLAQTARAPPLLYVQGDAESLRSPQLAMVGSRSCSPVGRHAAQSFAATLVRAGLTITSGLALGIDAASHEAALAAGGRTVAVLGSGIDRPYPPEHRALAERIAARGAVVSEFAPGVPPLKANFPRRNRIISGLSLGTLVIEAGLHSGSLITARISRALGRAVFAVPGSIYNPMSRGCHALIRGGAKLAESGADILQELHIEEIKQGLSAIDAAARSPAAAGTALDKDYKILLDALGFDPASPDALVERTGLSSQSVASMLLILEMEGAVGLQAGGRYLRLPVP